MSDVLEGLSLLKDTVGQSESGISWTSDRVTYPEDLKGEIIPDGVYSKTQEVVWIHKEGGLRGVYKDDDILFSLHGEFRAYDQLIENDPNSIVTPVMANVYITYEPHWSSGKATLTELEIHFTALDTMWGTAEDPRIRFVCEGHYDPAGPGDVRFAVVVEIDQQANVNLIEDRSGPDAVVSDDSPKGISLTVSDN